SPRAASLPAVPAHPARERGGARPRYQAVLWSRLVATLVPCARFVAQAERQVPLRVGRLAFSPLRRRTPGRSEQGYQARRSAPLARVPRASDPARGLALS